MPQARGKGNWMDNPRVRPPEKSVRLDNSAAKIENRRLNSRLLFDIDSLEDRKFKTQADSNHVLKKAKKDARVVFAQTQVLHRWPRGGANTEETERSPKPPTTDGLEKNKKSSELTSSFSSKSDNSDDEQSMIPNRSSRPMTSVSLRSTARSITPSTASIRGQTGRRQVRPKTAGTSSGGGQRSIQLLKDLVANDNRKKHQAGDAREELMLAMAEKRRDDERRLQLRLQRFYTDLDQFIKRTNSAMDFTTRRNPEANANFLMQFDKLTF